MTDTARHDATAALASTPSQATTLLTTWAPAFRSRNFRLFWLGQLISTMGTAVQVVAEGWLIYDITGSTFWLGAVGFLALLPVVPISLLGGVLIDRVPRRRLLLITQSCLLLQAALFGLLAVTGRVQLWHIIVLYFVFGAILAVDHPARRAFLVELVDEDALANAVALNATLFNVSSLVGYALAGVLIAAIGVGATMLFNAVTYLAPILALTLIRVIDVAAERDHKQKLNTAIWEGVLVLRQRPNMIGTMTLMAVVGGLAFPVFGMMPAFAEEVLQVGSVGLGVLLAAGALGSVIGAVMVARLGMHRRGRTLTVASLLLPITVAAFALTDDLWPACAILVMLGIALLIVQSLAITLVQVHIPDRVRGRVMSLYSQIHAGSDSMANVMVGGIAVYVGLPTALMLSGLTALVYAIGLRMFMPAVDRLD